MRRWPQSAGLALVEDCCQAHLATCDGTPVGTFGAAGAFSFYPTKNLGALGDGGAIVTGDAALAARMKRIRNGGQTDRYHHVELGVNSRLDEMQAAILRARLPWLRPAHRTAARAGRPRIAARLAGAPRASAAGDGSRSRVSFVSRQDAEARGASGSPAVRRHRNPRALPGAHTSTARVRVGGGRPMARWPRPRPNQVLSLPLHPALSIDRRGSVAAAVRAFAGNGEGKELAS